MSNQNRPSAGVVSQTRPGVDSVVVRVASTAETVVTMRVGDKVSQTAYTEGQDDQSYFRIKHIDVAGNVFQTDPNGPFDRGWKGRLSDWKPHPLYANYWVKAGQGVKTRLQERARSEVVSAYELAINWYGEALKVRVKAHSQAQALKVAASKLATSELKAFTAWHILQYMKNNESRVSVKPI